MGKIYLSLVLTLLVSLVVLLAGGVLARHSTTRVTSVDRQVLKELSTKVASLLVDWKSKRENALEEISYEAARPMAEEIEEKISSLPGVRGAFLFQEGRPGREWILLGRVGSRSPAEVVVEGGKAPLITERAIVVPEGLCKEVTFGESGRIDNQEQSFYGWWFSPLQGVVVLYLVEGWLEEATMMNDVGFQLQRDFERIAMGGSIVEAVYNGKRLAGEGLDGRMATAETGDGKYAVRAWDRRTEKQEFEWATMFGAIGLAAVIGGVGLGLFFSQQRMWHESEQRVSFVNRVSHELGTPLTNMTLNLELASRSLRSQPEIAGRRLEKVSEEVSRLGRLVTNVLTHSRKSSDGGQDRLVPCDPDAVVLGVLDQFRPALERRGIETEWSPGEIGQQQINADALSQIVWNLISNVEKYASSGEWLSVSVSRSDKALRVRVCDLGDGIPRDRRAKIFKPFERVSDSTKEGVSGTGLGLSISRDLAGSLGGSLSLVDDPQMTIFELLIPLKTT